MRKFLRENGLSAVVLSLFLIFTVGQSIAGFLEYGQDLQAHDRPAISYVAYLQSGHFWEALFENWESEFLQIGLYVLLTVWFRQRGSAESKPLDRSSDVDEDPRLGLLKRARVPGPVRRGGLALALYSHSLSIALLGVFLLSFILHAVSGASVYNAEQALHGGKTVTVLGYFASSRFWFESLQNWQSEFLSIGALVILSIFLREKGSPESKPVAAPHDEEAA